MRLRNASRAAARRWMRLTRRPDGNLLQRLRSWLSLTVDFARPLLDLQLSDADIAEQLHYPHR